ncbi:hypothetical protein B0H14DRAFT_3125444 [Mycena olivaceomarginata]|nr:hypothetical protein B0H14DRAFT_3125444 [Mycena olivaceomarginata]
MVPGAGSWVLCARRGVTAGVCAVRTSVTPKHWQMRRRRAAQGSDCSPDSHLPGREGRDGHWAALQCSPVPGTASDRWGERHRRWCGVGAQRAGGPTAAWWQREVWRGLQPDGLGKQRWGRGRCGATRKCCNGATTLTYIPTLAPEGKGEQRGSTTDVQRRHRCSSVRRAMRRVPMREEIHPSMKPELRQRGRHRNLARRVPMPEGRQPGGAGIGCGPTAPGCTGNTALAYSLTNGSTMACSIATAYVSGGMNAYEFM